MSARFRSSSNANAWKQGRAVDTRKDAQVDPGKSWPGTRLSAACHSAVLAVVAAAIYANLPIYGYVLEPGLLPKYLFFGMFVLLAPIAVLRHRLLASYLLSPFVLWASLLLALNLVHLAGLPAGGEVGGTWLVDVRMTARHALILTRSQYVLFALVLGFAVHASQVRSWLWALALLALLVPCAVMLDFAQPGLLYPSATSGAVLGRAAAMFVNPNMAGEAMLLIFLLASTVMPAACRAPLLLLAGAAIMTTFSRAAILGWVTVSAILAFNRSLSRSAIALLVGAVGLTLAWHGHFESYLMSRSEFDSASGNILARLDFFSSYSFDDDSAEERTAVMRAAWELFLQHPVFGAGAGATLFWSHRGSTHNQLLLLAAEYGLFGIGLWAWMLAILWRSRFFAERGLRFAMVFLYVFMSMFTHQMLDSATYWLASFAIASACPLAAGVEHDKRSGARRRASHRPWAEAT